MAGLGIPRFDTLTCTHQTFDSEAFGGPVLRLDVCGKPASRIGRELGELVDWARAASVKLISCRIGHDDPTSTNLEASGFRQVEDFVVYGRPLPKEAEGRRPSEIEEACEGDREACERFAARVFTYDRYHADPYISNDIANRIKRTWVKNSFLGRSDQIFVARSGGEAVAFVTCLRNDADSSATVDLIAVSDGFQGQGLGRALVIAVLDHYSGDLGFIQAGTQRNNLSSCRLYSGLEFSIQSHRRTYHLLPSGRVSA